MGGLNVTAIRGTVDGSMDFGGNTEGVKLRGGGRGRDRLVLAGQREELSHLELEGLARDCWNRVPCPGGDEDRCNLSVGKGSGGGEDVMRGGLWTSSMMLLNPNNILLFSWYENSLLGSSY